jgi:hypothetical protein
MEHKEFKIQYMSDLFNLATTENVDRLAEDISHALKSFVKWRLTFPPELGLLNLEKNWKLTWKDDGRTVTSIDLSFTGSDTNSYFSRCQNTPENPELTNMRMSTLFPRAAGDS